MADEERSESPQEEEVSEMLRMLQSEGGAESSVAGLCPQKLDLLARKIYLLLRRELVIEKERHGW